MTPAWESRIVRGCAWLTPVAATFGGALLMRGHPGDALPGVLCVVSALLMQSELVSALKTLLRFHDAEYRRLKGKSPLA